jgi:predicted Zn finger-like uncharacterized protein
MDVTCDHCKAEYDFDDTLLGDKGTTVKCSKCGHVFRVLPPRREPQRSALKVRFRDGRVENLASLRELQQRIQAGTVGVEDELGRDGFTFRRLGDVPELKNFFVRTPPASGPVPTPSAAPAQPALPHRGEPLPHRGEPVLPHRGEPLPHRGEPIPAPKRTMMGVGKVDVPAAPRVPNMAPVAAAQALAPTQPAAAFPKNTVQGRAPISSAPTSPNMAIPPREPERAREQPSQRLPISSAPTPTGTAPTVQAAPSKSPSATPSVTVPAASAATTQHAPTLNAPNMPNMHGVATAATQPAQRPAGPGLRIPDSQSDHPARAHSPLPPRQPGMGLDSIAPGALKAATSPSGGPQRPAPSGPAPVRLSLDEDDSTRPSRDAGGSSSKLWLYALALVAIGGAGWAIAGQIAPAPSALAPTPATPPQPAPAAAPAAAAPTPADAAPTAVAPAAEAPAPEKALEPAPAAPQPTEAPKAENAAKPEAKPSVGAASPSPKESGDSAGAAREPKDYSGWVGRGDQLLKKGDLTGAQQAFQQAVALRGTGSEANSGLGSALLAQGQTKEAIPFLTRAAGNGFAEASVALGDAYRKLGQKDAAIEAYETYLARLPKGARASYVKLQLEGLGQDVGGGASSAPSAPASPAPGGYRPAGELNEPAAEPKPPETP